jgi:class 3 adenylate cyclase/streptogramin lyase
LRDAPATVTIRVMTGLPRGTVSLLFTDIEGSTQLTHRLGERYREVVNDHRALLEAAFEDNAGTVVDRQTESFFAVFPRMRDAAAAAVAAQQALAAHEWPDSAVVKVRMGIHAGEPEVEGDRYVGLTVSRAARVAATAHGGQVILSGAANSLLADQRFSTRPLGAFQLKDFDVPEPLYQLVVDGLPQAFPRPRVMPRRSRRRFVVAGLAALAAIAGVAVLAALLLGGGSAGLSGVQANAVGMIDPGSNTIVDEVPVGIRPGPIAVGGAAAWVGNLADRTVTRVDMGSRTNAGTVSLDNRSPTGIAVGEGGVWVALGLVGKLARVDPAFGRVSETLDIVAPTSDGVVAVGGGSVWAAYGDSTLARIDPRAMAVSGRGLAGTSPAGVVFGGGDVWVANSGEQTSSRFKPETFEEGPVKDVSVGQRPTGIAFGAGAVWVANREDDTVTRIDPRSYSTFTIEVADRPVAVAYGAEAVWVASESGVVTRIDPATRAVVKAIDVGNAPSGIAVGEGFVWVTVQAPSPAT